MEAVAEAEVEGEEAAEGGEGNGAAAAEGARGRWARGAPSSLFHLFVQLVGFHFGKELPSSVETELAK